MDFNMNKKINFIQGINLKKGALSRQLGIPEKKNIPEKLLNKIIAAKSGQTIRNPSRIGKRKIKITKLIERRSILARNLKHLKRRRYK